ncbi:hypothetical protein [Streptomyces sp. R08]|uniref:Uncharacterized protein n=1 Tax=Streptomyces sp. R08 TaxID=3238624 RepID=A0AB39MRI1_9ACTN
MTADRRFIMLAENFSRVCIFVWKRRLRTSSRGETYRPATIRVSTDVTIEISAVVPHAGIQSGMRLIVERVRPFLDLRVGGLRLTIQRIPYPVLAVATGIAGSVGSAVWLGR